MPTTIKLRNSVTTTSAPSSLVQGEVAINITDKKVWVGNAATTPIQLLGDGGSGSFTSIAFGAGTVSSPSITFTGDTNTGIYSPAADTIAFTEGGVESMRIDSSGNVGIGTSSVSRRFEVHGAPLSIGGSATGMLVSVVNNSTAFNSSPTSGMSFFTRFNSAGSTFPSAALQGGKENATDGNYAGFMSFFTVDGGGGVNERMRIDSSGNVGIGTSSPNTRLQSSVGSNGSGVVNALRLQNVGTTVGDGAKIVFTAGTSTDGAGIASTGVALDSADLRFYTGGNTERMRIDSSGNVGIGTSSPSSKLTVSDGTVRIDTSPFSGTGYQGTQSNHPFAFITNNTERMRITSGGDLLVSKTASDDTTAGLRYVAAQYLSIVRDGNPALYLNRLSSDGRIQEFARSNTIVGNISVTTTATTYNTSSDYRLKENIAPMTDALGVVAQLKPVTYNWKVDGSAGQGFIAHELQEVVPDCVTGEKDAVNEEGKPIYQGIDTSFLVATLTAAIQEQQAMIEELKQEVAKLKGV